MKNIKLGELLKQYRKHNAMSVSDVTVLLKERYDLKVAEKTVYGWESSQANPPADTLIALCDLYKIKNLPDALKQPVKPGNDFPITSEERAILEQYRNHPELQDVIKRILFLN